MSKDLHHLRRALTQRAIGAAISATARLPIGGQRSILRGAVSLAGATPMLRRRVLANMRVALGEQVPEQAARLYFQQAGWLLGSTLATFHHGLAATPVVKEILFDRTVDVLDRAMAAGRGVVLATPHWSGHELGAGIIATRHPVAMLIRDVGDAEKADRKARWYKALGGQTVRRPLRESTTRDALAYLRILKSGQVLAMTPDLLAAPGEGLVVTLFGRSARLHAGAFRLAMTAGAPIIRCFPVWRSSGGFTMTFEDSPPPQSTDREAAVQACAQDWCNWFEERLRQNPENWLFWLDRRWNAFLHGRAP
ncbi:lysophospholipid acyltransferase family protein [Rhodoplanes sp. Z2-YC6860]|uniref:lysophospholipid acyltransferase family protein n=1 Tax=Rhodoplanes sp. Z2-YC6860 TaxID=674703 RepID=UPI00078BB149|nr:lysophospholipid acyltransferase family protein [Rhodoplanes sp. Z2-YC6860]AMN43085.1 lipid A biosynthesis acyltransferase [Rhodoplanes sp. Z2-YC6860]